MTTAHLARNDQTMQYICEQRRPNSACTSTMSGQGLYCRAPDKGHFFKEKNIDIFLISPQKHVLLVLIRSARWGASNEYQQHMFLWRNKKNICQVAPLIWSYASLFNCIVAVCSFHNVSQIIVNTSDFRIKEKTNALYLFHGCHSNSPWSVIWNIGIDELKFCG